MFTYEQIFKDKHSVLFVTAHPDDILVYYAALLHKLRKENKNVYAVTVTNGARGSGDKNISESELSRMRIKEETAALLARDAELARQLSAQPIQRRKR